MRLDELPVELLGEILGLLFGLHEDCPARTRTGLLRTCRSIATIALPLFRQSVSITIASLLRSTQPLIIPPNDTSHPIHPQCTAPYSQRAHDEMCNSLKYLQVNLTGLERAGDNGYRILHTAYNGSFFVMIPGSVDRYLSYVRLQENLSSSIKSLAHLLPFYSRLSSVKVTARCASHNCNNPWAREGRSFLEQHSIQYLLEALTFCQSLQELVLDTSNAEDSSWTMRHGVGMSCASHMCPVIAKILRGNKKLRKLEVRRREICPAMFGAAASTDAQAAGQYHSNLQIVIVNLRMLSTQRTGLDRWEALSRDCQCHCWCVACLRHQTPSFAEETDFGLSDTENPFVLRMAQAARAFAQSIGSLKQLEILSYDHAEKELVNMNRCPVVLDCLSGKKIQSEVLL